MAEDSAKLDTQFDFSGNGHANNGSAFTGRLRPRRKRNVSLPYAEASDSDLLTSYHAGDDQALEALLDRYEVQLFNFLMGVLRNHHQAEDTLQETWCRALQNLESVDGKHFRGWLFTVAYHQAMLVKRKQKGLATAPEMQQQIVDSKSCPVTLAQVQEESARVQALLDRLSPAQREVICQRIYEGKRFRDIADELDCPVNTALARMHEGLKRLRKLWGPDYA